MINGSHQIPQDVGDAEVVGQLSPKQLLTGYDNQSKREKSVIDNRVEKAGDIKNTLKSDMKCKIWSLFCGFQRVYQQNKLHYVGLKNRYNGQIVKWLDLGKAGQGDEYNQSPVYENSKDNKNEKKTTEPNATINYYF